VILSGDGMGGDLGYPSTVQLGDGALLSVWYQSMKKYCGAVLRQARWKLGYPAEPPPREERHRADRVHRNTW
jgi:hypothetical protein